MIGLYLSLQVFHSSLSSASCSVVVYECREILNSSTCHMMADGEASKPSTLC